MTEQSPSYLDRQPEALRLADLLLSPGIFPDSVLSGAGHELRRLHAENQALQTSYNASRLEVESLKHRVDEVGRIARENRSRAIVDLEAQISKRDFAIECYEKDLDTIKAALSADKYPGSKDWREGSTLERIQWLHDYCQGGREEIERLTIDVLNLQAMLAKANNQAEHFERHWYLRGDEIESLQAMLDAVGAGGVEPLRKSNSAEFDGIKTSDVPVPAVIWQEPTGDMIRAIARNVRTNPSDDAGPHEYVVAGWKAAIRHAVLQPQATPVRPPLTNERIANIVREAAKNSAIRRDGLTGHRIARAVEAAHGIAGKP